MNTVLSKKAQNGMLYGGIFLLWLLQLYMSLTVSITDATQHYNISEMSLRITQALFSLPSLLALLALAFAMLSFYRYSQQIAGSDDGKAFRFIAYALGVSLASMCVSPFITHAKSVAMTAHTQMAMVNSLVILANCLGVVVALLVYWLLWQSSQALLSIVKKQLSLKAICAGALLPVVAIGAPYIYLIFSNPERTMSNDPAIAPTYALPDPLIILIVALPYMLSWFLGLLAILGIYKFLRETKGIVYKRLFKNFAIGITIITLFTILAQFLCQFSDYWSHTSASAILSILAVLIIVLVGAYLLVANGARQLGKIEEVK